MASARSEAISRSHSFRDSLKKRFVEQWLFNDPDLGGFSPGPNQLIRVCRYKDCWERDVAMSELRQDVKSVDIGQSIVDHQTT